MALKKIYRHITGEKLFSFNDDIGQVPILGTTLSRHQLSVCQSLGLELIDIQDLKEVSETEFLYFKENLFFTKEFLKSALRSANSNSNKARFCLKRNDFITTYIFDNDPEASDILKFEIYKHTTGGAEVQDEVLDQKVFDQYFKVPKQIDRRGHLYFGQSDMFASSIISPFHLLYLNLAFNLSRTVPMQKLLPEWFIKRFIPVGGWVYYKSLKTLNRFGKNCLIHPTAVVEGCILGDNVKIGANCVVRLSHIGSGTTLEENVTLTYSVLGEDCYIANNNIVNLCMCYESVFLIHGPYQFSMYGKNVGVMAVINCDFRLDQKPIKFMSSQGLINSHSTLLGICYGHNSVVGGGNIIAPGRIVPNDIKITPPESIIISKFDKFLGND